MKLLDQEWFEQWNQTDSYLASDGTINRIPLRLTSSNVIIYGSANLTEVLREFEHEDYQPVTVDGEVPVQIWCNNFIDTDCGSKDTVNPYLETWYSFPVIPKPSQLDLPFENAFSYNVNAPDTLTWCHRVLCGASEKGKDLPAKAAIAGGREIWGFPKHPDMANLDFDYSENEMVSFTARHQGKRVMSLKLKRPESINDHLLVEADALTEPGSCITPKQNPHTPSFVSKQTRYTQAFSASMYLSPWDDATDSLSIYNEEDFFGGLLSRWNFEPHLKMHCSNLKIVAFKPEGWNEEFKG